ncbi:hypothetical protein CEXT_287731 [Caerostris extrusa]|uniref:Uncharacterized protein n=1 Tax=Caerostris extrusa TaxID=172846 RepID=A0AAV4YBM2_CAEEX|nr:hypothetical protein CEXT_287731 [Caerostris extrusa]
MPCHLTRLLHTFKEQFCFLLSRGMCGDSCAMPNASKYTVFAIGLISHPFDPVCFRLQKFELQENVIQI